MEAIAGLHLSTPILWKSVREEDEEEKGLDIPKRFAYQADLII